MECLINKFENKEKSDVEKNIKNYVESFFENAYFSKEVFDIKNQIIKKLNEKYIEEKNNNNKNPFEIIVQKYNSLESLVKSVNYDVSEIDNWFNKKITITYDNFNRIIKQEKIYIYIITALSIFSIEILLSAFLPSKASFAFIFSVILICIDISIIKKHKKDVSKEILSINSKQKLENIFDKYFRKSLIWLLIFFIKLLDNIYNFISLGLNSKSFRIGDEFKKSFLSLELILFFLIKNILNMIFINKKIEYEYKPKYIKSMNIISLISSVYVVLSLIVYYAFEKIFVFSPIFVMITIYCIFAIIYYYIITKKNTYSKKSLNINFYILIPLIILFIIGGGYLYLSRDIWLIQPEINSTPYIYEGNHKITYNNNTGIYTIVSDKDDFKMLQLTDIHLGGGVVSCDKDKKALSAVFKLINYTKPDLVVVTGDLTYPVGLSSFSFNNKAPVSQFAAFMRNTGVPWIFTYGNHDTENIAIGSKNDVEELYQSLSWNTSRNLLYPYIQPKINGNQIWGRNNQLVEIRNNDGTLNQALFLIDSNDYMGKGFSKYDYIHDDQVEWYKNEVLRLNIEEGKNISSLVFFHIPLQQYKTAYELFKNGSDEVKYFFGFNDEKTKDKVSASKHPSKLFDTAKELNSTKGFFCGHDHYNNMSLEYQGIRLTYGMSIDYLVEPGIAHHTKQRGATLITTHKNSEIDIKQIPLVSIDKK
ncbi:Metallo-dependent phosphatase [Anaeromyces robustus]|uniref:Metallo-dependent phosphatase n=1 Tax=Anaeromyces robustus TaxID=1754192 RepID=A0A1Y1WV15_9FUNG|nr:Metallo-dependent phosphatase [Anaeromyces robustus]|eukprot:ORX76964.1 Metallo-dependent phosphatase [Anaeromyces robustus]